MLWRDKTATVVRIPYPIFHRFIANVKAGTPFVLTLFGSIPYRKIMLFWLFVGIVQKSVSNPWSYHQFRIKKLYFIAQPYRCIVVKQVLIVAGCFRKNKRRHAAHPIKNIGFFACALIQSKIHIYCHKTHAHIKGLLNFTGIDN